MMMFMMMMMIILERFTNCDWCRSDDYDFDYHSGDDDGDHRNHDYENDKTLKCSIDNIDDWSGWGEKAF